VTARSARGWSATDLDETLYRYADSLAPDRGALERGRAALVAAFAEGPMAATLVRPRRLHRWSLATAFAVLLVAGASLVAAESGPGQPFYGLRVSLGSVLLPREEPAHARGLADQLDDRLTEAGLAARSGDGRAAQAAISEYLHTLSELTRNGITDPDILNLLQRHQDTLEELLPVAPAQASGGVQSALDAAGDASDVLPSAESTTPRPTPPQNAGPSPAATGKP
jgi:hypothetical protein